MRGAATCGIILDGARLPSSLPACLGHEKCVVHAEEMDEEGLLPTVNSSLMGACGYDCPAVEAPWFEKTVPTSP